MLRTYLPVILEGAGLTTVIVAISALLSPWVGATLGGVILASAGYSLGRRNANT